MLNILLSFLFSPMKLFSPSDIYDNIIQTIQQFPMEVFYFKRQTIRIDAVIEKYNGKLNNLIKRLPKVNEKKVKKVQKRLNKAYEQKNELVSVLKKTLDKHMKLFDKLNNLSNDVVDKNKMDLATKFPMVVKVKDNTKDNKLYCTCMNKAYGNMIRCNNEGCEIGWYHYKCVGFMKTPKQAWVCSRCIDK